MPSAEPFVAGFARDPEIAAAFSAGAEIAAILRFEAGLAAAQADLGLIDPAAAEAIAAAATALVADEPGIRAGFLRDGVPVPALVAALRGTLAEPGASLLHHGATSQDAVDTGLMLRLKAVFAILDRRLAALIERLDALERDDGPVPLMAQTRMQAALPFRASDKIATWRRPLARHRDRIGTLAARLPVQLGGPIGTGESFGAFYEALRRRLAERLGLADAEAWHSDRTVILDVATTLSTLAGTLGKIGQDAALMAQTEIATLRLAGGGTSSAMAHKQNPVGAEVLVALGRLAAGLAGTLGQSMIHENERSGAAWTLEWILLPQIAEATGAALDRTLLLLEGARFAETSRP